MRQAFGRPLIAATAAAIVYALATPLALADPPMLPDGPGKAIVERACARCHSLDNVVRVRRTRKQWEAVLDQMISRGATLSDDEFDGVAEYLATHVGPPAGS